MAYEIDEAAERRLRGYFETIGTCLRDKRAQAGRFKLAHVMGEAEAMIAYLKAIPVVKQAEIAGSYRGCKEG
jgi:hypothetical protein